MEKVAVSKMKKTQDKMLKGRPYRDRMLSVISHLAKGQPEYKPKYMEERDVKNIAIIVISSDKGLCGSFNSSLIKEFQSFCQINSDIKNISVLPIGKKAYDFFKNSQYELILDYWEELNGFSYEKSSEICDFIINSFIESRFDRVTIIYNEFKNVAVQKTVSENFLPVSQENDSQDSANNNYIFEPEKNKIIDNLIPQTLKTQLLKSVLESNASEQGSRMTAMSQATDNAGELLKELKLTYNRTRQAAITKEILEILLGDSLSELMLLFDTDFYWFSAKFKSNL